THQSCALSSTPTTPSPKKSAIPRTARTSAIVWFPALAHFLLSPTRASPITSRPCSSMPIPAPRKSTTALCTTLGPQKTHSSIAASPPKWPSIFFPTRNPFASTNPAPSSISFTNGPCAPALTPRKKSTSPPWTKSASSAKSIPNSRPTSALPATSAPASPRPSAPRGPTSAASKSGSTFPTSPAASETSQLPDSSHVSAGRPMLPAHQPVLRVLIYSLYPIAAKNPRGDIEL